jgi:hypothetical protein
LKVQDESFKLIDKKIKGQKVKLFINALRNSGLQGDGHAGKFDIVTDGIGCSVSGNADGNRTYGCSIQNAQ